MYGGSTYSGRVGRRMFPCWCACAWKRLAAFVFVFVFACASLVDKIATTITRQSCGGSGFALGE